MNQRTQYLLQVLEQIGSPLMASLLQAPGRGASDDPQQDARRMAELLAKTTQASIDMSRSMDFGAAPDGGDSLRVSLAALASGLIGAHYKNTGKTPTDADLKKIGAVLQTVLTYSENFAPGPDAAARLDNLAPIGQQVDAKQVGLQYIHAFIPVVNAITVFPFGNPEQKLIMDVAARIMQKAQAMHQALFPDAMAGDDGKRIALSLVGSLASIYASCHNAETARLMALSDEQRMSANIGMESVWKSFDLRAGMIEALAANIVPKSGSASSASSGGGAKAPSPPPQQAAPPAQPQAAAPPAPPPMAPPATPPPVAPPVAAPPPGGNPLSMFAKKPDSAAPSPAAPPSPPQQAPPAGNPPPAQDSGGSPMSFFKKKE